MTFIEALVPDRAPDDVRQMYDRQAGFFGYLPNYARVFSLRPEIMPLWAHLQGAIKGTMPLRRFELITLASAHELRSSYCCLAHSNNLMSLFSVAELICIVREDGVGVLSEVEIAVVRHARLVVRHADRVTSEDVDALRRVGLRDQEIFDITAAAAARAFFTRLVDGLGAQPDAVYADLDARLLEAMVVGRGIAGAEAQGEPATDFNQSATS